MRIRCLLIILILLTGCKSDSKLNQWQGNYWYSEEPVQALAGYSMVMLWELSITEEKGEYAGELEVNGQQTSIKLKTSIEGDSKQVTVKFRQGLEGFGFEQFQPGDVLFRLETNTEGKTLTYWEKLEPRLIEQYQNGKVYFVKQKKE